MSPRSQRGDAAPADRASPSTDAPPTADTPLEPAWLLPHRVAVPERLPGLLDRPSLRARCALAERRLTLVVAAGGFGKTTLLAACCHHARAEGVTTAWLTLDGHDDATALDAYLAYAFKHAGIDVLDASYAVPPDAIDPPFPRAARILSAVQASGHAVVLVLDEAERVTRPDAIGLLNFLVQAAPPNLHLAIAARELPAGLDVVSSVFASDTPILTANDLQFTRDDIARLFDGTLSRRDLAELVSSSSGWPLAVRASYNDDARTRGGHGAVVQDVVENWIASDLWRTLSGADHELLLDAGLFDWFDAELLGEVLGDLRALPRLRRMRALDGLLKPTRGGDSAVWELHTLIRDHCTRRRAQDTPDRYRTVHAAIARALARRGRTVAAMRHAAEANDAALAASVLLDAGGVRLWLREGLDRLVQADRFLPAESVAAHPRLAFARCVALVGRGRAADAWRTLASVPTVPPEAADADLDLYADRCLASMMIDHFGYAPTRPGSETMVADMPRVTNDEGIDPLVRGTMAFAQCVYLNMHALFDDAITQAIRAQRLAGNSSTFLNSALRLQLGQVAMARGQIDEALAYYREGLRLAKAEFLQEPYLILIAHALIRELELERGASAADAPPFTVGEILRGTQVATVLAASDGAVQQALAERGVDAALETTDHLWEHARQNDVPALSRYVAGLRVSLLADAGRRHDAHRIWQDAGLPATDEGCVDLDTQNWREAESLCCARLRLLAARRDFEGARRLLRTVVRFTRDRGLRRTLMRVHILAVKLEHQANAPAAALGHLTEFFDLFAETAYAGPLLRERDAASIILKDFLDTHPRSRFHTTAQRLLVELDGQRTGRTPTFSERELEVLGRLETRQDAEIAAVLGITHPGVRYHVANIFRKLKTRTRQDAVRRARALGILPAPQ